MILPCSAKELFMLCHYSLLNKVLKFASTILLLQIRIDTEATNKPASIQTRANAYFPMALCRQEVCSLHEFSMSKVIRP
jgi:hypothetical protein